MIKKYHDRNEHTADGAENLPRGAVLDLLSSAVLKIDEVGVPDNARDDDELSAMSTCWAQESLEDVATGEDLTAHQRTQVRGDRGISTHVFTNVPGGTDIVQHQVKLTTTTTPIQSCPYLIPFAVREELRKDIEIMLKMRRIRESRSPYERQ